MPKEREQRWWERKERWVAPADRPLFDPAGFEVRPVAEGPARAFVEAHHYSGSYVAARVRAGVFDPHGELVGVAVFSVGMNPRTLPSYFGPGVSGVELGRFVLTDELGYNAETWVLRRAFAQLRRELPEVQAVLAFSDPVPRKTWLGDVVTPGHVGTIYKAFGGRFLGRSEARTRYLDILGREVSLRGLGKIRGPRSEREFAREVERLVAAGAPDPHRGEEPGEWVRRALGSGAFATIKHPGNLAYAWSVAGKEWTVPAVRHRDLPAAPGGRRGRGAIKEPGRLRGRAAVALVPGRRDRDYCICPVRDGKLYVMVPDFESLLRFLVTRRWDRDPHVKTAAGYVPHFGGAIAFHAGRLVLKGFKPLWYSAAHPRDVVPQLLQDGVYADEWEAHQHLGGHPEECEWIGPSQFAFEPEDVAEVWVPRLPASDLRSRQGRLLKQFVPKGVKIRRGLPRRIGTSCREHLAERVAEGAGSRWGGRAARAPQGPDNWQGEGCSEYDDARDVCVRRVEWTRSPLSYHGDFPQRVQLLGVDAGPPPAGSAYFAPTVVRQGRRKVKMPGADPDVVAFLDFDAWEEGGGHVYIHYMRVRSDQQGRGRMRELVTALYERFASAAWIDWGDIHHDAAAKLFRERHDAGVRGEGPRTHGRLRT